MVPDRYLPALIVLTEGEWVSGDKHRSISIELSLDLRENFFIIKYRQ